MHECRQDERRGRDDRPEARPAAVAQDRPQSDEEQQPSPEQAEETQLFAIDAVPLLPRESAQSRPNSFLQSPDSFQAGCLSLYRMQFSSTRRSISVRMKQR